MKKTKSFFVLFMLMSFGLFLLSSCKMTSSKKTTATNDVHEHKYEWSYNSEKHWQECTICNAKKNEVEHVFDDTIVVKESTATTEGQTIRICTTCGYKKTETTPVLHTHTYSADWDSDDTFHWHNPTCTDTTEVSGKEIHKWNSGEITKPATEQEDGIKTYTCTTCGKTKTEVITKLNHEHVFSPTWASDNTYHWHVAVCEHTDLVSGKELHNWDNGRTTKLSTITEEGEKVYTCTVCGETKTEVTPKLEHTHSYTIMNIAEKYLAQASTCTSPSKYYYSCSCGEHNTLTFEVGSPLGHSFTTYVSNNDATCTSDATKTAKCDRCDATNTITDPNTRLGHTYSTLWSSDDNYHWHQATCEHANEVTAKTAHTFDNGTVSKEPTYTSTGEKVYTCTVCGKTKIEVIPVLIQDHVHDYSSQYAAPQFLKSMADCTNPASYYYSCTCGSHNEESFTVGSPLGHSFTTYISNNDATCSSDGTKTAKCDRCDETNTITDSGSKLPHTYSNEWTYDETYHWHKATCEHTDEISPKEEHTFGAEITVPSTITSDGYVYKTCTCGYEEYIRSIDKLDSYTVEFYDDEGTLFSNEKYLVGANSDILIPNGPSIDGKLFIGWYYGDININEYNGYSSLAKGAIISFYPRFVNTYDISFVGLNNEILSFKDGNGNLVTKLTVQEGTTITTNPSISGQGVVYIQSFPILEIDGYNTIWSLDELTNINSNKVIKPTFTPKTYSVTFIDAFNNETVIDALYGTQVKVPNVAEYYVESKQTSMKIYVFDGWDKDITYITGNITIHAIYKEYKDSPVVAIKTKSDSEGKKSTVSISIINPKPDDGNEYLLYGLNLSLSWNTSGIANISNVNISDSPLDHNGNKCTVPDNKDYWVNYSNKEHTFSFSWGCGQGHSFNYTKDVIEINFNVDNNGLITKEVLNMLEDSFIVYGTSDENPNTLGKEKPLIVFYE